MGRHMGHGPLSPTGDAPLERRRPPSTSSPDPPPRDPHSYIPRPLSLLRTNPVTHLLFPLRATTRCVVPFRFWGEEMIPPTPFLRPSVPIMFPYVPFVPIVPITISSSSHSVKLSLQPTSRIFRTAVFCKQAILKDLD